MKTLRIVPHFNELEDGKAGGGTGKEGLVGTLGFEGSKETLLHGIVVAIPKAANAERYVALFWTIPSTPFARLLDVNQPEMHPTDPPTLRGCKK